MNKDVYLYYFGQGGYVYPALVCLSVYLYLSEQTSRKNYTSDLYEIVFINDVCLGKEVII